MGQASPPDDGPVETEISSDAGYPFAEVVDPARSFTQALAALGSSNPGQLQPIIQQAVAIDPKLAVRLDSMLQSSGLSLV